jgi:hypothetical protein
MTAGALYGTARFFFYKRCAKDDSTIKNGTAQLLANHKGIDQRHVPPQFTFMDDAANLVMSTCTGMIMFPIHTIVDLYEFRDYRKQYIADTQRFPYFWQLDPLRYVPKSAITKN